ncbi:MAG: amidophosphoribosyltransferase [Deltaproteobacteria bacterium]|nr:amidophosphoribosyltransferase [Deltaproteobacteria bacterium]
MSDLHDFGDHFRDECGVVGVWGHREASTLCHLGLHALQHRGQEGAGIVSWDGEGMRSHRGRGLVADVFGRRSRMAELQGERAIGHVRYSTAGTSSLANVQPLQVTAAGTEIGIAHNGNLVNAPALREELSELGAIFQTTSDTELIVHLMARSRQKAFTNKLVEALGRIVGAWSLLLLTPDRLVAARDPMGFRPLVLGRTADGAWVVASETCALDLVEAAYVRDVEPGEIVIIDSLGLTAFHPFPAQPQKQCVFEHLYFARPDTQLWGQDVYSTRVRLGERLAQEQPAEADVVVPVPDSGVTSAIGYAAALNIPFSLGLIRNHYVGRSFIEPTQRIRDFGVKLKLNPVPGLLVGKRVVVVDDSIVRGTTCRKIVRMLRRAGAAEVHLRIAAPPTTGPCFYGIDTPNRDELIASSNSVGEIGHFVGADSIGYLSIAGMHEAVADDHGYCDACFSGRYPIEVEHGGRPQLALFD